MAKRFSKTEIKHLKHRLINQEGLTPLEADTRIKELIAYDTFHNKKLKKRGKKRNKLEDFMRERC